MTDKPDRGLYRGEKRPALLYFAALQHPEQQLFGEVIKILPPDTAALELAPKCPHDQVCGCLSPGAGDLFGHEEDRLAVTIVYIKRDPARQS